MCVQRLCLLFFSEIRLNAHYYCSVRPPPNRVTHYLAPCRTSVRLLKVSTTWRHQRVLTPYGTGESYRYSMTISILKENVLLKIFVFYRSDN